MAYKKVTETLSDPGKIVALYVRVSTGYQVDKDSLPFQKKELKAYCKHILHIDEKRIEVFEDAGKSAKNTDRPAFQRMMNKVRAGQVSHVIVYKIDRVSRDLVDFSIMWKEFKAGRVTFISLNEQFDTSSAIGEAVLKIILVFAELERKLTSERVKDIMIGRAHEGKWNGARMPYGWKWNSEKQFPEHNPEEIQAARLIYSMYEKTKSSSKVRDYFNNNNIPTKRGGEWTTKTISDYIRNPMNKGDYRYNYRESPHGKKKPDEEVVYIPGVFPPLVDPDQWDRCNAIMDHNAERLRNAGAAHNQKHIHLFAGLIMCGACGSYFQSMKPDRKRANGFRPSLYRCSGRVTKRSCTAPGASDVKIGPVVFNFISHIVAATKKRQEIKTPEELESLLLSGPEFAPIAYIEESSLHGLFDALQGRTRPKEGLYLPEPLSHQAAPDPGSMEAKRAEAAKIGRALDRLKKLFLFDDSAMNEKEYLSTRAELTEQLTRLNNEIRDAEEASFGRVEELNFVSSASSFLLSYSIQSGEHIQYNEFAAAVDDQIMKDFLNLIIDYIVVSEAHVTEIHFKSGLHAKFIYKSA